MFKRASIFAAAWLLACIVATAAEAQDRVLALCGPKAPAAFVDAAKAAGLTVVESDKDISPDAELACVVTPFNEDAQIQKKVADAVARMLTEGKRVVVSFGEKPWQVEPLVAVLPINLWSVKGSPGAKNDLRRPDCKLAARPEFAGAGLDFSTAALKEHCELHLPYAPIEAGEHRYNWSTYAKDALNTDWTVLLATDNEGALPLLIQSRVGPGTLLTFGGNLFDPQLMAWSDYSKFIQLLLKPAPALPVEGAAPDGITLKIERHQPASDGLHVAISNSGPADADVLIAYKISNGERALLNSATQAVHVTRGQTLNVALVERSKEFGDTGATQYGDRMNYRYIDAACTTAARRTTLCSAHALVDTHPAVTLEIVGEDVRAFEDLRAWPEREMGAGYDSAGGSPIPRYVYFTGAAPKLEIALANGLHNIAPLAVPEDLNWKENPSAQGLNDLACSTGSLRGTYPLYGAWSGRPAPEQRVALTWDAPVLIAGQRIVGDTKYRQWDRSNPRIYELLGDANKVVTRSDNAAYIFAAHRQDFNVTKLSQCQLHITDLDPAAAYEPKILSDFPDGKTPAANCTIVEWEILGWPHDQAPPDVDGALTLTLTDLRSGKATELSTEKLSLAALKEKRISLALPVCTAPGPMRIDAVFSSNGKAVATAAFDLLVIEPGHKAIEPTPSSQMGLLCSPGFVALSGFGTGTQADVRGWGGPDDKIWSLTHDMMEQGSRYDQGSGHLFTTAAKFCHYTCPWREFPSGEYYWDFAAGEIEKMIQRKGFKLKTPGAFHIFLSDRWNGIPVGASMCWSDFIRFDEHLRKTTGSGLKSRGRVQLAEEISKEHGDEYQKWQMNRYADKLLDVQQRLAKLGVKFTVTTHGSFPLAGGELGAKLGKTHVGTGTDLFWELKNEDLYHTLGFRFGLIAANPDLESGAYNEWGWCSSAMNNPHWYSYTGAVEPSRRQWYSTYFMGRVTSAGAFEPLTKFGFHGQGGFGVKNTATDWREYYRTQEFTTRMRPEEPCGVGLVVSWPSQERHMSPHSPNMGFGLLAGEGFEQVDSLAGTIFERLARRGVPITFVASTDTLKQWHGAQPLLIADGYDLETWEFDELGKLNRSGAPLIAIGAGERNSAQAADLFRVKKSGENWEPLPGVKTISNNGHPVAFVSQAAERGSIVFCPIEPKSISAADSTVLAQCILEALGAPLEVPQGIVCDPFISQNQLFIALNNQGDISRTIDVSLKPALLKRELTGKRFSVIDLDRATRLATKWDDERLKFALPIAGSEGRMILITKDEP